MAQRIETPEQRQRREDREASLTFRARRYSRYANHLDNYKSAEPPRDKPALAPTPPTTASVEQRDGSTTAAPLLPA